MVLLCHYQGNTSGESTGQMILNAGDAYQTVTIVPSDTNPGEVSYVLIVQQPDDKDDKGDDQDLTVYDFDEGEEGGIALVSRTFVRSRLKHSRFLYIFIERFCMRDESL